MRFPVSVLALALSLPLPLLAPGVALAQKRGVAGEESGSSPGPRRAVIIGISKYNKLKPENQLAYAAADAQEFYDFLRSPAGGAVPRDRIQLLLNENATAVNVGLALYKLRLESQAGDEAIIYFAGHGDVESLTGQKGGYLLANDAPPGVYSLGGALAIASLADFVQGIVDKGASVLVITDACHSGKLVGDPDGAKRTTLMLLQTWGKVAKFVSSDADQVSYEGTEWGGGHGAFTYFLILGLQGLADMNGDGKVDLSELAAFVTSHVKQSVKQFTGGLQVPQSNGQNDRQLALVDSATRRAAQLAMDAAIRPTTQVAMVSRQPTGTGESRRGGDGSADSALAVVLAAFHSRLASGALLEPPDSNAWQAYEKLARMPDAAKMMAEIKTALGGALQASAQEVVFDYFVGGDSPPTSDRLRRAARELTRAIELFGQGYELATPLRARLRFLEGYAYVRENKSALAIVPLRESIALDSSAAYAYNALGFAYLALDSIADSRRAFLAAKERAPRWSYPNRGIALLDKREGRTAQAERQLQQVIAENAAYIEPRRDLAALYAATKRPAEAERMLVEAFRMDSNNVKTRADLGGFYQEQGRYADAIRLLERVIVLEPDSVEPFIRLSISYFYSDRTDDAVRMAQRAIAIDSKSAWAYRVLGYYSKNQKKYDEAERAYRRGTELAPSWGALAGDHGGVLLTLGRLAEAETELRRAENLDPKNADTQDNLGRLLEKQSRLDLAELAFRRALELDSLNSYRYDMLGWFYFNQKRFTEAEVRYRRAVELDPKSARLAGMLGSTYRKLGRPTDAIRPFMNAIHLDSLNAERYNDLGVAAFEMAGEGLGSGTAAEREKFETTSYEAALAAFDRASYLQHSSGVYAGNLGITYRRLGRISESEREYKRSIALDSLNPERYVNLAALYWDQKRFGDAVTMYGSASRLDPKSAIHARSMGATYRQMNDTASSIREYRRAVSLDSMNYARHTDLGIIYYWAGKYEEARAAFSRAAELSPQSAVNARNLGLVLNVLKRPAEAEQQYRRAIELDPTYAEAHNSLGQLFYDQGKFREAEANWRATLKVRPGDASALNNIAWVLYARGELTEAAQMSDQSLTDSTLSLGDRLTYMDTRANIALDSGNARVALDIWDQTIKGNAHPDPVFFLGRAMSLLDLGREGEAVAAYRQAIASDPKYGQHDFLAKTVAYSAKGLARLDHLKVLAQAGAN